MKNNLVNNLLILSNQVRMLHWQTKSYAQHQAFGGFYDFISDKTDQIVESLQGKMGENIILDDTTNVIKLLNYDRVNLKQFINSYRKYFSVTIYEKGIVSEQDLDIQDLILDILNELNKLEYLLSLS